MRKKTENSPLYKYMSSTRSEYDWTSKKQAGKPRKKINFLLENTFNGYTQNMY